MITDANKLICKQCGKKFEAYESDNRKYCSRQCYGESKKGKKGPPCSEETKRKIGEAHLKKKVKLICKQCGREFEVYPSLKNQQYCSKKCMVLGERGRKYPKELYPNFGTRGMKFPKELYPNFGTTGRPAWSRGLTKETDTRVAIMAKNLKETLNRSGMKVKISKSQKENWKNPEFQKMMAKAQDIKPNTLEQFFDKITPGVVRYIGDGKFFITTNKRTHNPDFKVKGQKKIIELFGDYWHKGEDPKELIKEYKKVGWDCIVFWEHEVLNKTEKILDETLKFIKKEVALI